MDKKHINPKSEKMVGKSEMTVGKSETTLGKSEMTVGKSGDIENIMTILDALYVSTYITLLFCFFKHSPFFFNLRA